MLPTGTRVTIRSVDHLPKPGKHQHLIGRTGTVVAHENDMNIIAGLTWHDRATGLHVFADDDLEAVGEGVTLAMPTVYRVRGYYRAE